jgi:hypothetical protein
VQFGLQFETIAAQNEDAQEQPSDADGDATPPKADRASSLPAPANPEAGLKLVAPENDKPTGEVVRLDRFRKK